MDFKQTEFDKPENGFIIDPNYFNHKNFKLVNTTSTEIINFDEIENVFFAFDKSLPVITIYIKDKTFNIYDTKYKNLSQGLLYRLYNFIELAGLALKGLEKPDAKKELSTDHYFKEIAAEFENKINTFTNLQFVEYYQKLQAEGRPAAYLNAFRNYFRKVHFWNQTHQKWQVLQPSEKKTPLMNLYLRYLNAIYGNELNEATKTTLVNLTDAVEAITVNYGAFNTEPEKALFMNKLIYFFHGVKDISELPESGALFIIDFIDYQNDFANSNELYLELQKNDFSISETPDAAPDVPEQNETPAPRPKVRPKVRKKVNKD